MNQLIDNKYIIRLARPEDAKALADMEQACFPPAEACPHEVLMKSVPARPECYIVAALVDTDEPVAMVNVVYSDADEFDDSFFINENVFLEGGKNAFICGVETLEECRGSGLAHILMEELIDREKTRGTKAIILTCHDYLVPFYEGMGYRNLGRSKSSWGGAEWYEMEYVL